MKKMYIAFIIVVIVGGWYGYSLWQKQQGKTLNKPEDKISTSYNLDGLVEVKVPQSFRLGKKHTIGNFYGLAPIKDKFVYSFYLKRAEFNDFGGYSQAPIILSLTIYNPQVSFDDWNHYIDNLQTGDSSGMNGETKPQSTEILKKDNNGQLEKFKFISGYSASHSEVTLLVYSSQNQKYRLGLLYWKNYLTDAAANKLMNDTIFSINIKATLSSRVQAIEDAFYKKYPEKKP